MGGENDCGQHADDDEVDDDADVDVDHVADHQAEHEAEEEAEREQQQLLGMSSSMAWANERKSLSLGSGALGDATGMPERTLSRKADTCNHVFFCD
jgi:hypothetical protein